MQNIVPPVPTLTIALTVIGFLLGVLTIILVINLVRSVRLARWRRSLRSGKDLRDQSIYLYAEVILTNRVSRRMISGVIHSLYDPKKDAIRVQVDHPKDSYVYRKQKLHRWVKLGALYPEWSVPKSKRI